MDKEIRKLKLHELLERAANAACLDEIKVCLAEIERRKKIFQPGLLQLVADRAWTLASCSTSDSISAVPDVGVTPVELLYWPDTLIIPTDKFGKILPDYFIRNKHSALGLCGYHTGKSSGLSRDVRRDTLANFMERTLHPRIVEIFGDEYGDPLSPKRLKKMANVVTSLCKLMKRKMSKENNYKDYSQAIRDYESDHKFLEDYYYKPMCKGRPPFPWPDING